MVSSINVKGRLVSFDRPLVMGVINVTPDSFYTGSRFSSTDAIIQQARKMVDEGARFLDIGGYSSRPGAEDPTTSEEIKRIREPLRELRRSFPELVISVDTFRVEVAEAAINEGADMINDISGGHLDSRMYDFILSNRVPYVAMHMKGDPQTMARKNQYDDLIGEIIYYFSHILELMNARGFSDVIIDPGFGFAKNVNQNFELLDKLEMLSILEKPLLVGLSRKSMIYKTLGVEAENALNGTTALNALALYKGANILRVHDVAPAVQTALLIEKMKYN